MAEPGESQASEVQATGTSLNLVDLFQAGENGIERRRTENLFKQLDERQLTEDEQAIIQQRVELQRKMFQEYERREKQRKMRELQEVCPDLDEDAARRALELCNWKEEEAAERVSSDPAFLRRVRGGPGAAALEHAPAPRPERQRSSGSRAAVGPRPKLVDPSQVGAVFVGRFKSRLGPHQISAMGRQQQQQQQATGTAAGRAAAATTTTTARRGFQAGGSPTAGAAGSPAAGRAAAGAAEAQAADGAAVPEAQDGQPHARRGVARGPSQQQQQQPGRGAEEEGEAAGAADGDTVMADGDGMAEAEPEADAAAGAGGDAGGGGSDDGGDDEEEHSVDPNSADLSDNELQYEDDVLPVMSPLAGKRQRHGEAHDQEAAGGQEGGPAAIGHSPVFRYKLVAEASNGNVHSVATDEWRNVLQQHQQHQQHIPHQAQEPGEAGAAAGPPAAAPTKPDDDEVSSPATGHQPQVPQQQPQRQQPHAHYGQAQPTSTGVAAGVEPSVEAAAAAAEAAAAPAAGAGAPPSRPRRVKAELAAVIRQVAAGDGGSDGDAESEETATDGDSDFEVGAGGRGGGGGGRQHSGEEEATSSDSDDDDEETEVEEEDLEEFVAPGSRKRRAGTAAARPQQRKRAASGGSGAGAAAAAGRRTRQRNTTAAAAAAAAAAPAAAPSAAAAQPVGAAGDAAAGPTGLAPGGDGTATAAAAAAGPSGHGGAAATAADQAGGDDSEATVTEDESPGGRTKRQAKAKKGRGGSGRGGKGGSAAAAAAGGGAISASGHTCRGRVKQKGVKRADLLSVGTLIARQGWYNAGYIFPAGFKAQTLFRSSVDLDSLTLHTCEILGETGQYWPAPTFVVTAADRPDEPLVAKSCTGCWTAVLRRINGEIEGRRAAGEDLPPPPKTAIAGPEYFGLNQPEICAAIEALDLERKCSTYWDGKMDREAARGGQAVSARGNRTSAGSGGPAAAPKAPRPPRSSTGGGGRNRRGGRRGSGDEEEPAGRNDGEEDPEETYAGNRWSAVTRAERYRKRCEDAGEDAASLLEASNRDNPLPGFLDPITLEPVFNPAISPYGHVMGLATWKAVLAEQGRCPFTKQPLKAEALTVLTKNNIERYRSRIIQQ